MKKYTIVIIVIFWVKEILICQITPYQPIQFYDFEPSWVYVSSDSSLIDDVDFDGLNHFFITNKSPLRYIISDGYLYIVSYTVVLAPELEGGLVEKIDLISGKPQWTSAYDLRTNDRQEYFEDIFLDSNGQLVVVTARRIRGPENFSSYYYSQHGDSSLLSIRKYDISTGELLSHQYPEPDDLNAKRIRHSSFNNALIKAAGDDSFIFSMFDFPERAYYHCILNEDGYMIDTLKKVEPEFEPYNSTGVTYSNIYRMWQVSADTLVTLDYLHMEDDQQFDRQTTINVYNRNMDKQLTIKVDPLSGISHKGIFLSGADHHFIYLYGFRPESGIFRKYYFQAIFNYEGELVRQFNCVDEGGNEYGPFQLVYLEKEQEFLLIYLSRNRDGIDFFLTSPEGTLRKIKSIKHAANGHILVPQFITQLSNGDVLVKLLHRVLVGDFYWGNWPTWMRIKAEDLGLHGTSIQQVSEIPNIYIHPNPAAHSITISHGHEGEARIEVLDVMGRVLIGKKVMSAGEDELDVSVLNAGVYVVRVLDRRGVVVGRGKFLKR